MKKPNYELKAQLLGTDYAYFKTYRLVERSLRSVANSFLGQLSSSECSEIIFYETRVNPEKWLECKRISNAYRSRVKRLKSQIKNMLSYKPCVFGTLTFDDKSLNSTSEAYRRKCVREFLKAQTDVYIANVDYGAKNHREHYHFIGVGDKFLKKLWRFGGAKFKPVRVMDPLRLAKYIAKLTNHAIKETTKNKCLIYSDKKAPAVDDSSTSSKTLTLVDEIKALREQQAIYKQAQSLTTRTKQLSFFETENDGNLPY